MSIIGEFNKNIFLTEIFRIVFVQIPSVPNTKVVIRVNDVDMIEPIRGMIRQPKGNSGRKRLKSHLELRNVRNITINTANHRYNSI